MHKPNNVQGLFFLQGNYVFRYNSTFSHLVLPLLIHFCSLKQKFIHFHSFPLFLTPSHSLVRVLMPNINNCICLPTHYISSLPIQFIPPLFHFFSLEKQKITHSHSFLFLPISHPKFTREKDKPVCGIWFPNPCVK